MIYIPPTLNESWIKLLPYPQVNYYDPRVGDDMADVSNTDIYIAGIYMIYQTLSHITTGDICSEIGRAHV